MFVLFYLLPKYLKRKERGPTTACRKAKLHRPSGKQCPLGGNAKYHLNTHPVIGTSSAQSWQAKYLRSHRQNLTV